MGVLNATGANSAAGIGGGLMGSASCITINGGNVTAIGDNQAAGIGAGSGMQVSNIFVADNIILKADNNNPPTTVIVHASITTDVASSLEDKQYATAVEQAPASEFSYTLSEDVNEAYSGVAKSVSVTRSLIL